MKNQKAAKVPTNQVICPTCKRIMNASLEEITCPLCNNKLISPRKKNGNVIVVSNQISNKRNTIESDISPDKAAKNKLLMRKLVTDTIQHVLIWRTLEWDVSSNRTYCMVHAEDDSHSYILIREQSKTTFFNIRFTLLVDGLMRQAKIKKVTLAKLFIEIQTQLSLPALPDIGKRKANASQQKKNGLNRTSEKLVHSEPKKKPVASTQSQILQSTDFAVRTNIFKCVNKTHPIIELPAQISIINKNGNRSTEKFRAAYCAECNVYYIHESDYKRLKEKGILECTIVEKDVFAKHGKNAIRYLKSESPLMQYGYNVKATTNLTDYQRQELLAGIIDAGILPSITVKSYLSMFAAQKRGIEMYENAVAKWDADLKFVQQYKTGSKEKVYVHSILKTNYKNKR